MSEKIEKLSSAELQTTTYLHSFMLEILSLLAGHFGGSTTLNHLRIGNYIGQHSLYDKQSTNNKQISADLGLSRATVSRIVSDFVAQGWVIEEPHPEDGRRRNLRIMPNHPAADRYERDFRALLNELLGRYESGEIVLVDAQKQSF